ncbi:ABC transporter substrate-binding protein [Kitasatospora sp. CB02891]|uniref:ABC transporter substrate-binding protein n=1 Tax=Kitasatospora sp. CB02891 TaxID=2020329 RepID=UPI000C273E0C|nr:ABC transporter substrate-binding protein [Kitasatospora sp. CB02891]PJN25694.1 ABC transporter substrate-binding protein [Kitasatospora sp. CB02891]
MRTRALCGLAATAALLASGCAGSTAGTGGEKTAGVTASRTAAFPVKVVDCQGRSTTFGAAPGRIVTSNAAALEMLLELGVGDQVIGTGFPPGAGYLPAGVAEQGARIPVLGSAVPAKEKLLGSGADLYIDSFASTGAVGGTGGPPSEQEFAAAGIKHVYLLSTACAKSVKTDLAEVEQDIKRLGAVTGTLPEADRLVAAMDGTLNKVATALGRLQGERRPGYFFFDYDAGTKQPTAVCNRQIAHAVITLAGARNVFADCDADFKAVGWEDVVARNPDWIQLGVRHRGSEDADRRAFDEAEQFLRTNPVTRELTAVRQGHLLRIGSEVTTVAGVRNADTVQRIARALHPDLVKDGQ